jgi:hypothetical protein
MLSQQAGSCRPFVDPLDTDALVAGSLAGDDRDIAAGKGESVRQKGDQRVVGGAVDRTGCETDENGAAPRAVDTRAWRPGNNANIKNRELQTAN